MAEHTDVTDLLLAWGRGDPQAEMVFGEKTRWTYPALTVVFVGGRVTDVKF